MIPERVFNEWPNGSFCEPKCAGCGSRLRRLTVEDARILRDRFNASTVPSRAFECDRCEVVIFEDEFTLGEFLPPQFRKPDGMPVLAARLKYGYRDGLDSKTTDRLGVVPSNQSRSESHLPDRRTAVRSSPMTEKERADWS
ncbi:MAG: hypothetical protein OK441_02875 [Thaumarchaeota archaeon]|nr:hypothetical protein [Nitrososphaerota archaeon]